MSLFTSRVVAMSLASLLGAATLTGCGSSSSSTTSPQGQPSDRPGLGISAAQQKKIQQCLKAAGLSSAFPSGAPSGGPSGSPPSGFPSGSPSGFPSGIPSGGPRGAFNNPQVKAALKACGLTLPTPPGPSGSAG